MGKSLILSNWRETSFLQIASKRGGVCKLEQQPLWRSPSSDEAAGCCCGWPQLLPVMCSLGALLPQSHLKVIWVQAVDNRGQRGLLQLVAAGSQPQWPF